MKYVIKKKGFNLIQYLNVFVKGDKFIYAFILLIFSPFYIQANNIGGKTLEKTKVIEKSFDLGTNGEVRIKHKRGPIRVERTSGNKVEIKITLKVKGDDEGEIQEVFNQLDLSEVHHGNRLEIESVLNIKSWSTFSFGFYKRTSLVFKDGTKLTSIKEIDIDFLLLVPKLKSLELSNKYENIYLEDMECDVKVNLYSADLKGADIVGDFDLKIKYGKVKLGNMQNATLDVYDSDMILGDTKNFELESKYSEIEVGDIETARLDSYDDKIKIGKVNGDLNIKDKYSDFKITSFENGNWAIYDSDFIINGDINELNLTSKYSSYVMQSVGKLNGSNIYDDDFKIKKLGDFNCTSKYGNFEIGSFSGQLDFHSYDDDIIIRTVENSFKGMTVTGKYSKVILPIGGKVKYALEANLTYGSVDYPESNFENIYYKEKSSKIEIKGKIKGASADAPKIKIEAYDSTIKLQ